MFIAAKSRTTNKKRVLHKGTMQRINVCSSFGIVRVGMLQGGKLQKMWLKVMEDPSMSIPYVELCTAFLLLTLFLHSTMELFLLLRANPYGLHELHCPVQ